MIARPTSLATTTATESSICVNVQRGLLDDGGVWHSDCAEALRDNINGANDKNVPQNIKMIWWAVTTALPVADRLSSDGMAKTPGRPIVVSECYWITAMLACECIKAAVATSFERNMLTTMTDDGWLNMACTDSALL